MIDGSMVVDRIATDIDPSFDELVDSIKTSGQQVPVLVRPAEVAASRSPMAIAACVPPRGSGSR